MEPITLISISLLGMIAHSLLKIGSLSKDYAIANKQFNVVRDYLLKDWAALSVSVIVSIAWYFLFKEAAAKFPAIEGFIKTSFFVMGAMGSYVAQLFFSVSKKYIRKVIDLKTNIADNKE